MADGSVIIDVLVKLSEKDLTGLTSRLQKAGDKMKGIGNVLSIGVTAPLLLAGKAALQMASDLDEVQNVVDVTFGKNAGKVNKWAESLLDSFGIGELSAKKFVGTMGAMTKSMGLSDKASMEMSMRLTELTGDFASFYNLEHEEAFEKIRSGIAGETEPLKQLGINMSVANLEAFALSQGIKKSYDSMSEAEKATLRYNYLLSQTADAQGDYGRTSDSFANQTRHAKEEIQQLGASIAKEAIPVIRDILKQVNEWLKGFRNLSPETKRLILTLAGIAAAAGPVIRVLGSITSGVGGVISGFKTLIGHAATAEKGATGLIGIFTKLTGATAAATVSTAATAAAMDAEAASATAATTATTAFSASLGLIIAGAALVIAAAVAINNAIEAARYTTEEWSADTAEGFEKLNAAIEQSNGVMEIYVADTTAAGKSVSEAQDAIKAAEANLVAAYQQYMNDKAALRDKDLADIRRYNEEYIAALRDELSAYVAAQNLLSTKLKEGLLDVTGSNVADVLKSMAEARDQAIQAAREQADAEATFWQSQFDQGEITKQQLTEQLNLLEKNKNASIEAARGAYAEQNYWAQKSFVENNKNLQKQLKNLQSYGQEVIDNTDWYEKEKQRIENETFATATGRQEALNQLEADRAKKQRESRAAWLQMLDAQTKGGIKMEAQTKSMVQGIIASLSTMGGSFEDIGEDSMVSLGRAIISAEDPKAAMTAQKSACIEAFKKAYMEFQETGSGGVDAVAKGMTDKKDGAKKDAEKVGKAIAEGLDSGYKSIIQKVIKYVQDSMKIIQRAMLMAAEINSPSRLTRPVGEGLAEGVGVGFTDQMRKVRQQIQANAALELGRVRISALNLTGTGGGGNTYNISHTIQSSVPLSLREIRQEMLLAEQRNRLLMGV